MLERRETEREQDRTGRIKERRDARKEGCRAGGMQCWRNAGKGSIQGTRDVEERDGNKINSL